MKSVHTRVFPRALIEGFVTPHARGKNLGGNLLMIGEGTGEMNIVKGTVENRVFLILFLCH